ncbi:MAG: lipid-A-disaccharide synthase [Alphaproteobacteria bacterium]|nr:lipid-A-disaccharide synthase [Alphaproteobacteria bacterium]
MQLTLLKIVRNVELELLKMQNKQERKDFTVFIIAGEVSGDVLGAKIMEQMPDARFVGIGGENMMQAGLKPLFPMGDLAVMGIVEVLAHAKTLTKRIKQTVDAIINEKPDIVVSVDAPGFAKSVIKQIRKNPDGQQLIKNGLNFHHVVAPQVWAWRSGRAKKYARTFDKLYAFFDFEIPYFTKYGLDTVAVGHPIADGIIGKYDAVKNKNTDKIITLVPGSRMSEVKRLMPLMGDMANMLVRNGFSDYKFVIPTVETTREYVQDNVKNWLVKPELVSSAERYKQYSQTYIALVASGTVSAELAMMHVPTIVVYKMNPITTWIGKQIIRVKWVSLVNILLNRSVYPEFLGGRAKTEYIMDAFGQLTIPSVRQKMVKQLQSADELWRKPGGSASQLIAQGIREAVIK